MEILIWCFLSLGRLAQLVEQLTLNQRVVGSIPTAPTRDLQAILQVDPPSSQ